MKRVSWQKLGGLVEQTPTKERLVVRTGCRVDGRSSDGRVLGAYGLDV